MSDPDIQPLPTPAHEQVPKRSRPTLIMPVAIGVVLVMVASIVALVLKSRDESDGEGGRAKPVAAAVESTSEKHQVRYSVDVGKACGDFDTGYDDIAIGTEVEVVDGSGTLLGIGELNHTLSLGYGRCEYSSAVFDVKKSDDGFYRVTAGNSNRGYLNHTEDDFNAVGKLLVNATLG